MSARSPSSTFQPPPSFTSTPRSLTAIASWPADATDVKRDVLSGKQTKLAELRTVQAGEGCPRCDGTLDVFKALEIGHIFKLGTKYSDSMGATVLDAEGKAVPIVMGSYGIGVERILAAAIELHHDENVIKFPVSIAPFQVAVLTLGPEPELEEAAAGVVKALTEAGVEVLHDDRGERAGVKFKDADLIGIPIRISIGKKGLAEGKVKWKMRPAPPPPAGAKAPIDLVPIAEVAKKAVETIAALTPKARVT